MEQGEKLINLFEMKDLPDPDFMSYWDGIVIDEKSKRQLLNYCIMVTEFKGSVHSLYNMYGLCLLDGPSGSGKTTLLKGCANKVAEHNLKRKRIHTKFLEINVSQFFSEYLGKTLKLTNEAFYTVRMAARHGPVILLLDEIESLGMERTSMGAGDPTDVIRGVNVFLTELDKLRFSKNALILATTNIESVIDRALLNRVDLNLNIPNPSKGAAIQILKRSADELKRKKKVKISVSLLDEIVKTLYNKKSNHVFSGRDISRILPLSITLNGCYKIRPEDVKAALEIFKGQR